MKPIQTYKLTKLVLNALENYISDALGSKKYNLKKLQPTIEMFYSMTHGARDGHSHLEVQSMDYPFEFHINVVKPIVEELVTNYNTQIGVTYDLNRRIRNTDDIVKTMYLKIISTGPTITLKKEGC